MILFPVRESILYIYIYIHHVWTSKRICSFFSENVWHEAPNTAHCRVYMP